MDIKEQIKKMQDDMAGILDRAEAEDRQLTDDEQVRYDGLDIKLRGLQAAVGQTQRNIPLPPVVHHGEGQAQHRTRSGG